MHPIFSIQMLSSKVFIPTSTFDSLGSTCSSSESIVGGGFWYARRVEPSRVESSVPVTVKWWRAQDRRYTSHMSLYQLGSQLPFSKQHCWILLHGIFPCILPRFCFHFDVVIVLGWVQRLRLFLRQTLILHNLLEVSNIVCHIFFEEQTSFQGFEWFLNQIFFLFSLFHSVSKTQLLPHLEF